MAGRPGDRLTGLVDRDAFARAVDQADRDRDRLLVAVITVDGLAEVNQLCGYDAGDSLLGSLGRVLADRVSVDLTAGRIGGSHLGLLLTPVGDRTPAAVVEPILAELGRAVDRWVDDRAGLGTPSPIVPRARIGVAAGYGGGTWADAEVALAVGQGGGDRPASVYFDLSDPRLARHRRRQRLAEELAEALQRQRLVVDILTVRPLDGGSADDGRDGWDRLLTRPARRSRSSDPLDGGPHGPTSDDLAMAPGLAARLDGHLLARAADLIDDRGPGIGPGPAASPAGHRRVGVPLVGPVDGPRSTLDGLAEGDRAGRAGLPAGIVIEVEQRRLVEVSDDEERASALADKLDRLGLALAVTGFDGGWAARSLLSRFPVHHLRPRADLAQAAIAGDPTAAGLLRAGAERQPGPRARPRLVVPAAIAAAGEASDATALTTATEARLRRLGVTHIEQPTA